MVANVWEQQPGEAARMYKAARMYFDLGPKRSQSAVAQHCCASVSTIGRWASRHNWKARAEAYDTYRLQVEDAERRRVLEEVAKMEAQKWFERVMLQREEEWEIARALLTRVRKMLASPIEDVKWDWREASRLIDQASRLVRVAGGEVAAMTVETPEERELTVRVEYVNEA